MKQTLHRNTRISRWVTSSVASRPLALKMTMN